MSTHFRLSADASLLSRRLPALLVKGTILLWLALAPACAQTVTATVGAGTHPLAMAVNPLTNKIYVANNGSNNVTVIDGATNTTATVSVGDTPGAIAVNPVTNKIYVVNFNSDNVTVIDGASNTTATVTVGTAPAAIAVNPVTNKIYVANFRSGNVTVIDGATNTTATIAVDTSALLNAIAMNPVTNKIYVVNARFAVTVIDGATNTTTTVGLGEHPTAVAVDPVTNKIYVAAGRGVTVIDGVTNTTATVTVGTGVLAIALNPVSNKIYVSVDIGNQVTVIDGATSTIANVIVGTHPVAIAVNPVSNKIYVANHDSNSVTVIDGFTNATATLGVGTGSSAIAINPLTNNIYVGNFAGNNVTVISEQQVQSIPLIPLTTNIAPFPGDQLPSRGITTFNFTTNSSYQPIAPPVQNVYFQLDTLQGPWQQATGSAPNFTGKRFVSTGAHTLYAFAADGQFADSIQTGPQSSPIPGAMASYSFTVGQPTTTSLSLTSGANLSPNGALVAFTATVSSPFGTPTGFVTFYDNNSILNTTLLSGGSATFSTAGLTIGVHKITVLYEGNINFWQSTSAPFTEVVFNSGNNTPTTTAIARKLVPDHVRPSTLFIVQVFSSGTGLPQQGNVVLLDGSQQLGPLLPISAAKAQYTTPLNIGAHQIRAVYLGGLSDSGEILNGSVSATVRLQTSPRPKPR